MFLVRRNRPLAWQGYYDGFQRGPEFPVKQPWGQWGDMDSSPYLDGSNQLVLPSAPNAKAGGVSFEFMPFTPCYGHEYQVKWPIFGPGDQFLQLFIMPNWSIVGPNFTNTLGVRLMHMGIGGDSVRIQQWANMASLSSDVASANSPVPLDGSVPLTLKVWVEDDRFAVVWVNGILACQGMLNPAFYTGPGRRGMNLMQFSTTSALYQWANVYDRRPSCPSGERWVPGFSDDFNRPNGQVDNGWSVFDPAGQIYSGSYATTGGSDGHRAIIRDSGITSGYQRATAVVSSNVDPPNANASAGIFLRANAEGTQALACLVFSDQISIVRMSGSLTNPTWSLYSYANVATNPGDRITFSTWGDWAWVEINGERQLYAANVSSAVPASNSFIGLRVSRTPFNDSLSWDSVDFFSGIGF
ncbi:hypothetical protein [Nocardia brasiliensis]|uniref:hypothetical protein n=1 Tax=Nocardia brasiliensis TaxID=37326 RepID=UPI0024590981|nr:hypothetical protein [Nocardia brasiliensis]